MTVTIRAARRPPRHRHRTREVSMNPLTAAFAMDAYHPALCARCGHDHGGVQCPQIHGRTTP